MYDLKPEYRTALEPFAMLMAGIDAALQEYTTDELKVLKDACGEVTTRNCWCHTYSAAQHIHDEVIHLLRIAERSEASTGDNE